MVCGICTKSFSDHTALDLHMQVVHRENQHQNIERKMKTAQNSKVKKKPVEDDKEGDRVNIKPEPKEPENFKVRGKSNDCSECGIVFKSEKESLEHIKEKHNQRYTPMSVTLRGLPLHCD